MIAIQLKLLQPHEQRAAVTFSLAICAPAVCTQVLAVGSLHSVTRCLTNDGGTVLAMSGFNRVLGLTEAPAAGVRVQAGCKLADLQDYLAENVRAYAWVDDRWRCVVLDTLLQTLSWGGCL